MSDPSSGVPAGPGLTLRLKPDAEHWGGEDDDRWRTDLADLQRRLGQALPQETYEPGQAPGQRGAAEVSEIILALGSAGAVTAMVEVIKAWIGSRPGKRKVKVDIESTDGKRTVVVESDGLGAEELTSVTQSALGEDVGRGGGGEGDSQQRE